MTSNTTDDPASTMTSTMTSTTTTVTKTKKKKSKAQLKRLMKRAAARGETYEVPTVEEEEAATAPTENKTHETDSTTDKGDTFKEEQQSNPTQRYASVAKAYLAELERIDKDSTLKSKERRSAKRRAEAIALQEWQQQQQLNQEQNDPNQESSEKNESSSTQSSPPTSLSTIAEMVAWYEQYQKQDEKEQNNNKDDAKSKSKNSHNKSHKHNNPYIVFVGQLSYQTTQEALYQHFYKELTQEFAHDKTIPINPETLRVRLLTHKTNQKQSKNNNNHSTSSSRGMAFVQVNDPQLLYACLKLHHTYLEGRRINVERTAGGGKGQKRVAKLQQYREEQTQHILGVVDGILQEFMEQDDNNNNTTNNNPNAGSIRKGELDEGVVALCQRHAPAVVQAALQEYVDKQGRDMDNPSAYLTFLLGKMAQEGIREKNSETGESETGGGNKRNHPREFGNRNQNHKDAAKRQKTSEQ